MTSFSPVPTVGRTHDQSPARLRAELDTWGSSEPLAALVQAFGGTMPEGSLADRYAALADFSRVWDYRGRVRAAQGTAERNQTTDPGLTEAEEELAMAAATALGLVEPEAPSRTAYDHVLINGALVRYSIWRTAYAAYLVAQGLQAPSIVSLTTARPLARSADLEIDEPTLLARYDLDPDIADEAEMMEFLLRRYFDLPELDVRQQRDATGDTVTFGVSTTSHGGRDFAVVSAPALDGKLRANTADTMRHWASTVANLEPGQRILSVSSNIYGPYQHADALRTLGLPFGVEVESVAIDFPAITQLPGVPAERPFKPFQFLQELRSTILGYQRLLAFLDENDDDARPASW